MQYIWAEAGEVFGPPSRSPYVRSLSSVEDAVDSRAREKLSPRSYGGMVAEEGEYAAQTLRPRHFADSAGGNQLTDDFRQNQGSTGWATVLYSDSSDSGTMNGEFIWGLAGFAFLEPTQRFTELRVIRGDTTFPVINVEEAKTLDDPVLVLNIAGNSPGGDGQAGAGRGEFNDFVFDKDNDFTLEARFTSTGDYYVKPLGVARVPQTKAIAQDPS